METPAKPLEVLECLAADLDVLRLAFHEKRAMMGYFEVPALIDGTSVAAQPPGVDGDGEKTVL